MTGFYIKCNARLKWVKLTNTLTQHKPDTQRRNLSPETSVIIQLINIFSYNLVFLDNCIHLFRNIKSCIRSRKQDNFR